MSPVCGDPQLMLYDIQAKIHLDIDYVRATINKAIPLCVREAVSGSPLGGLEKIEVSIVSDPDISEIHGRFLDDPTATDVITFDHGEIIVSADMAEERSSGFGHSTEHELVLYIIHGLLHLAGYNDKSDGEFKEMSSLQEKIWKNSC